MDISNIGRFKLSKMRLDSTLFITHVTKYNTRQHNYNEEYKTEAILEVITLCYFKNVSSEMN